MKINSKVGLIIGIILCLFLGIFLYYRIVYSQRIFTYPETRNSVIYKTEPPWGVDWKDYSQRIEDDCKKRGGDLNRCASRCTKESAYCDESCATACFFTKYLILNQTNNYIYYKRDGNSEATDGNEQDMKEHCALKHGMFDYYCDFDKKVETCSPADSICPLPLGVNDPRPCCKLK